MRWRLAAVVLAATVVLSGCKHLYGVQSVGSLEPPPPLKDVPGTYLDQGRYHLRRGDVDQARRAFIRAARVDGETAAALTGIGIAYERQGLLSEARRYFERALALAPDSVMAHNNLGTVYYKMGDYQAAHQAFQIAFALSSGLSTVAAHNLGITEKALREAAAQDLPIVPNPHQLQREGVGEYRLINAQPSTTTENGARHAR